MPKVTLRQRLRSLFSSLGLRLFLWLTGISILAFSTYTYMNIRSTSELWNQTVLASAQRFSNLIERSTHYSMLLNRKEDVRQVIQTIARQSGVDGVRIYDKRGVIVFSADAEEIGRQVDQQAEACVICHDHEGPLGSVPADSRVRVYRSAVDDSHRVLGLINPIENSPDCSSAPCHAHSSEQRILGVLDVKMSMARADRRLEAARRQAIVAAAVMVLLIGISSGAFISHMVRRPVKRLIRGSQRVARGDLTGRIEIDSHDEIGQLGHAFNHMTRDLQQAREEIMNWSRQLEGMVHEKTGELEGALEEIRDLERRKSHYMRISAHQLRSPLSTVKTSLQVLTEGYEDTGSERGKRLLKGAGEGVDSLLAIVTDLLELAKIREGQAKAPWTRNLDMGEILQGVLETATPVAQQRGIRLVSNVMDGAVLSWGVPTDIRFALENIVENAIKYSHSGGEVRVDLKTSKGHATLTVTDEGIGVPVELQRDVFLEFVRAPGAKHHAPQGTGLGLAIVKAAVEMHGGSVTLQSDGKQGTTFIVSLALRNALPSQVQPGKAPGEPGEPA